MGQGTVGQEVGVARRLQMGEGPLGQEDPCTPEAQPQTGCAMSGTRCLEVEGVQVFACLVVGPGFFFDSSLPTVASCPAGTYSADRNGITNTWALLNASDATATGHLCLDCEVGTYASTGAAACTPCETGRWVDATASTSVSACADVNECASNPCVNGAACSDSSSDESLALGGYRCTCEDGYASGSCAYEEIVEDYIAACSVGLSTDAELQPGQGNCAVDVDECVSSPCLNSGECHEHVSEWVCQCATVMNPVTGLRTSHHGERCEIETDPCEIDEDDCDPINADCRHLGPGQHECACHLGWDGDGQSCLDIDECSSGPCQNGGVCTESACTPSDTPCNAGTATCVTAVVAACEAANADEATCAAAGACTFRPCRDLADPNCVGSCTTTIDPACASANADEETCIAAGACTFTAADDRPPLDSYRCACSAGFAGGLCAAGWDSDTDLAAQYGEICQLDTGGLCNIDFDECVSSPCQNSAGCSDSTDGGDVTADAYSCACEAGYANGACNYAFIELYAEQCTVAESSASETLGGNCDVDVDECASSPCANNALCEDSTAFTCDLDEATDGTADCLAQCISTPGVDAVEPVIPQNAACTGSPTDPLDGFYDVETGTVSCFDNSCTPDGCPNCPDGCSVIAGVVAVEAVEYVAPTCTPAAAPVSIHAYRCTCAEGFASGTCHYDFIAEYTAECSLVESSGDVALGGNCELDVDECASSPCLNDAVCTESSAQNGVAPHAYQCTCAPGFANGACEYAFIPQYETECTVVESTSGDPAVCVATHISACGAIGSAGATVGENCTADWRCTFNNGGNQDASDDVCEAADVSTCLAAPDGGAACVSAGECTYIPPLGGNCDIDVDECASSPCLNGAVCSESSVDASIGFNAYSCACEAGYANGACNYAFIELYAEQCTVAESSASETLGGNCDVDVDECASSPCANNALCTESSVEETVSVHAYQCTCADGFANGVCEYSFIAEYSDECAVSESSANETFSGNCDLDVNECASSPCQNGAACTDSTANPELGPTQYTCVCALGFVNGQCEPDDGCTSLCLPTYNEECDIAFPTSTFAGNCDVDVNECASSPCQHGGRCEPGDGDFSCECPDYTVRWAELPPTITSEWLAGQAGVNSSWMTDTDCEVREYYDYRCEPGQEVNSTDNLRRGGFSDTYNCVNCGPGTFSPDGVKCEVCPYPDVILPVDWWCRPRFSINGTLLEEGGPCQRNLECTRCPEGLVPNNSSTACVEPDLGASSSEDSASSTVAAVVPTAAVDLLVSEEVFSDPEMEAALRADLVRELAAAMNLDPVDIIVEGLEPADSGRRRMQDEAWRAAPGAGMYVKLVFTIRPGAGAGSLYALENALATENHPAATFLASTGMDTGSFEVGARCPAGKTRTGDDTTCYKCPFPKYTLDRENCIPCPEGQVPTDKGDGCRCGDGHYNQSTGYVNCFTLYEKYDQQWDFADKSKMFDPLPHDTCSPCPLGGGADSCVSCVDGIVRVNPGYGLGDPDQQSSGLPIDAIAGPRPVFECLIKSQCLGDVGPNITSPELGAPAEYVSWENSAKCAEARLNGQESTCTSRGSCLYTPGIPLAAAVPATSASCAEPADGSGPGNCATAFQTADPSLGATRCGPGCVYTAAAEATPATTEQAESCVGVRPVVETWCADGYEGPLCSNCIESYARGGVERENPCFTCVSGVPDWVWPVLLFVTVTAGIAAEALLDNAGIDDEEDDSRPMADRAVALVIGNGVYDTWPNVDGAAVGSNRVAEELSSYGYRVIHCNNIDQQTFRDAVAQYQTAVGEMAAVAVKAKRIKACGVQDDATAEDKLLKELNELSLKDLRTRAMDDGADAVTLEELLHNDDPKEATVAFCLGRELAKAQEEAADDNPLELSKKPWVTSEQKLLEEAWAEYIRVDEQFSWDVADGKASDNEWQQHRDDRWSVIAEKIPDRTAEEIQERVKQIGKNHIVNPPGMHDGEVACMFYYCGHGCQIEGRNFLVPCDSSLNPSSTDLMSVEEVLAARCGDQETQDRIGETVQGPSIVVVDAARWVAPGSLDKEHRDTFVCPITKEVMVEPVYLAGEPTGWRYEKAALEMYLDGMQEKKADYRSPMSARLLYMPNTVPPKLTRRTVLDTTLQHRIKKYTERSTLNKMEPIVENTILVFSARPNMYADREGALFTGELLQLMDGNDAVGMLFTKASIRTLRASEGKQVCWDFNAMTQIGTFCINGKKPVQSQTEEDGANSEDEEVLSILQQSKDQAKSGAGGRSSSNLGPSPSKGVCGKPKVILKSIGENLGKVRPPLKQFVGMTQILAGMSFAFNIQWPDVFNQVVEYSKALSIDFASIIPVGCVASSWTFTENFYFQIFYPPIVLAIMLVVFKMRRSSLRTQVNPPDKEIQFEHEALLSSSLSTCFTFVFMIYPAVSQTIFQALIPQRLDDDTVMLRADFQVDYESAGHVIVIYMAIFMVLVYPIGFPASIAYMLYANREGLLIEDSAERKTFDPLVPSPAIIYGIFICRICM